ETTERNGVLSSRFGAEFSADNAVTFAIRALEADEWILVSLPLRGFRVDGQEPLSELDRAERRLLQFAEQRDAGTCLVVRIRSMGDSACTAPSISGVPASLSIHDVRRHAPILISPVSGSEETSVTNAHLRTIFGSERDVRYEAIVRSTASIGDLMHS